MTTPTRPAPSGLEFSKFRNAGRDSLLEWVREQRAALGIDPDRPLEKRTPTTGVTVDPVGPAVARARRIRLGIGR